MKLFIISVVFFIGVTYKEVEGGVPNVFCPKNGDYKDGSVIAIAECSKHCEETHGAVGGNCGDHTQGDYNCYCGPLKGTRNEQSLHCAKPLSDRARNVCTVDCMCNHGALGGYCNWDLKACVCFGENRNNEQCQLKTLQDVLEFVHDNVGPEALNEIGMKYINGLITID